MELLTFILCAYGLTQILVYGKIFDDLGNFEQGDFKEGIFNWQWQYNYKELNGVWNLEAGGEFSETIYFYENRSI